MTQLLERKQEEAQATPVAPSKPRRTWLRTALVVIAVMVVAAVGYAVYEAASNGDGGSTATGGDSNSVAIVNQEIARQLALRYPDPSSVEIVNEQIALQLLDSGPSSVEIVNEQIALQLLDSGPSSVEIVNEQIALARPIRDTGERSSVETVNAEIQAALDAMAAERKATLEGIVANYQEHLRQSRLTSAWDQEHVAQYVR